MGQKHTRFVAYFDILGMKQAVLRDPDEAWRALSGLQASSERILKLAIHLSGPNETIRDRVRTFIMSDSVVIFTLGDQVQDLRAIIMLSTEMFSYSLHKCVPLRGGIAHGDFYFNMDLNLYLGVPLVKAFELAEATQWLGIVLDHRVAEQAKKVPLTTHGGKPSIIDWEVPLRDGGNKRCSVMNWPLIHRGNFTVKPPISVADFYRAFERLFGPYDVIPDAAKTKYENTVEFINSQLTEG